MEAKSERSEIGLQQEEFSMEAQADYKPFDGDAAPNETPEETSPQDAEPIDRQPVDDDDPSEPVYDDDFNESLSAVARQYAAQTNVPRRIHIMGTGSIGKLVAHALQGIPNPPPITLILHRYKLLEAWKKSRERITVQDGEYRTHRGGFDVELAPELTRQHGIELGEGSPGVYELADTAGIPPHEAAAVIAEQRKESAAAKPLASDPRPPIPKSHTRRHLPISDEPIHNLILTTKCTRTLPALLRIRHRLSAQSTICLLQNGMGIPALLDAQIFPDPLTRPTYVQGIVTHGANTPPEKAEQDPFFVVHAGHGSIALGILPREVPLPPTRGGEKGRRAPFPATATYLLRTLTRSPSLGAIGHTPLDLHLLQLEKLAINCIISPLTVLLDCPNGGILYNYALTRTMRLLLAEISLILRSLPELAGIPNLAHRFSAERLETLVVGVAGKTGGNVSSMLADVRAGRGTEVGFVNGYVVRRGEEVGVKAVVNFAVMELVRGKGVMVRREVGEGVPVSRDLEGE